jgi:hypothetical protein
MRYADSLLTEGEIVVHRTRQHWLALLARSRMGLFLWAIAIVLLIAIVWFNVSPGLLRDLPSWLALLLLALGLVVIVYRVWQWWAQDYMITNRRLVKVNGILNKRSSDSSLEKINDATLVQSVLGRALNYGDLEILTAADMANDLYRMLNHPKEFKKVILTQKHALETEYMYGQPPSPPLRAPDPTVVPPAPAAAAPAPATTPAVAPPTAAPAPVADALPAQPGPAAAAQPPAAVEVPDESLEITQTLSRLADLRDSGAITAEEYEQKKDELLGRL